jgi:MoaA/NifB/PqqE/SkfB family radical SAM enzyme
MLNATPSLGKPSHMAIQLDITNACNLRCTHCYHSHHKNSGALSLDGWFEVLEQYEQLLNNNQLKPSIVLCGGEPTTSPYLFPVLDKLNEKFGKPPVFILTNGTLLNSELLTAMKPYDVTFQVSLDGPDSKRHDAIRGQGSFEKAIQGARLAFDYGIQTNILAVLSKKTSLWISDFFQMARENDFNAMNFTRFIPQGFGKKLKLKGVDDSLYGLELRNAFIEILRMSKQYGIKTSTHSPLYQLIDPSLGKSGHFGYQGLVVDYRGNLKVSSRADYILGNVLVEGLENLFVNHPLMKALRQGRINGCGQCIYYVRCGGDRNISYATTGSFLEKDIGCWIDPASKKQEKIA